MRFIVDECTGNEVAKWLRSNNFEVFSVFAEERGADDEWIIEKALKENYVIITNDKDFGELVYRKGKGHRGVIFLRLKNESLENKINVIRKTLERLGSEVNDNFIVASEDFVRISRSVTPS